MRSHHNGRKIRPVRVHPHRRGSIYLLVLVLGLILTMMGIGSIYVSRAAARTASDAECWSEAQVLASSGVEHALAMINGDANWRSDYNGSTITKSLGRGTFSWSLADANGGSLPANTGNPFYINATGTVGNATYSIRVHNTVSGSSTITSGVSVNSTVSLSSIAKIDSYDSSKGAYGGTNVGSQAVVSTNTTANGGVSISSIATVNGSVQVGPGSDPNKVISIGSLGGVTGTTSAMSQAMSMPTVTAPTNLGTSSGDWSCLANQTVTVSGNLHVDNLTLSANSTMKISGNVTILAEKNVTISANSGIEVLPGATLTVYVKGALTISSNTSSIMDNPKLSSLEYIDLGTSPVTISSNSSVQGVIIAPNAAVNVNSNAQVYGAVLAQSLTLSSNAQFHEDKHITNQVDVVTVSGGGSSKPKPDAWTRITH